MKVVILAGGLGTRISEESRFKPKPMIEIGGRPILWHIMKTYSHYGFNEFVICAGYKQEVIKDYFSKYFVQNSDITFDYTENQMYVHHPAQEDWKVTDRVNLIAGLRSDYHDKYGLHVTPKLSTMYRPCEDITLRASYCMGFRTPSLKE